MTDNHSRRRRASRPLAASASIRLALALCIGIALATHCAAAPPGQRLLLCVGSNTLGENAVPYLAKAYLETKRQATNVQITRAGEVIFISGTVANEGAVYIEVHATGSGDCFKSFLSTYAGSRTTCDIGMSSRRITGDELVAIEEKTGDRLDARSTPYGPGTEHPVALDGLAIIVHHSNPVARISFHELHDIYSKIITDWRDLADWHSANAAATGLPIIPMRRREPSGTLDFFMQHIKPVPTGMKGPQAFASFVANEEEATAVAQAPGAIGFIGQSYPLASGVKRLQVYDDAPDGAAMTPDQAVFPDAAAVQSGRYPFARVAYFYTAALRINHEVQPFIDFTLSDDGQAIIQTQGGLITIKGTRLEQAAPRTEQEKALSLNAPAPGQQHPRKVILRLHGSNTIGADCAVRLAINYLVERRAQLHSQALIEDLTSELKTPEGEQALAHDVMCDLDGDGTWETLEIRPTGSSDAFRSLLNGWCDIGMSSRHISDAEVRDLDEVCGNLAQAEAQFALGLDALSIIAHPQNAVDHLTLDQVARIFLGSTPDWAGVGGAPGMITVHARPERSGTYRSFCDALLQGRSITGDAHRHAENRAVAAAITDDPQGIGFVPAFVSGATKVLGIGHDAASGFYLPTHEHVRAAKYPPSLCRYVYLYVPAEEPKSYTAEARINWQTAREFARMSQSWRGQLIVAASGFVPEVAFTDADGQLAPKTNESALTYAERLTATAAQLKNGTPHVQPKLPDGEICSRLLFGENQTALSPESRNALQLKLPAWLELYPDAAPGGFIAEGWTDDLTRDAQATEISSQRAHTVASIARAATGRHVNEIGKGSSPYPPNDSEENKHMNRRVVLKIATK